MRGLVISVVVMLGLGTVGCGGKLPPPTNGATYKCTSYNTNERCQVL